MKKNIIIFVFTLLICSCNSKEKNAKDYCNTEDSLKVETSAKSEAELNNNECVKTSSGYSTDPDYKPTVSDRGEYHTIDNKAKQIQYQGSSEQQRDLDMIDEYARTHPDF